MAHRAPLPLRAWSPTPVIRASLLAHAAALGASIVEPRLWLEILGLVGANHALLACGMRPRSAMLGANLTSLPRQQAGDSRSVAVTFDDGPDPEVTPRLLDLLDAHGAKASFFVIGRRALQHPHIVRDIVARGHSIENHTYSHPHSFGCWTPGAMMREILQAQDAIANACGQSPAFFRAPAGIRNPLLDPVLAMTGLQLVTWTRRGYDTISPNPNRVYDRLTRGLKAGDILLLHDRSTRRGSPALTVTPLLLERLRRESLTSVSLRMTRQDGFRGAEAARAIVPTCP
jgi:peptidoglycan/xylan/chitin deacetylase (PgdA/CDA1 family)